MKRIGKVFTPHGFRYTLPTLFDEMGVSDATLLYLLGHSKFHLGNLRFYKLSDHRYVKELTAAQIILETLMETALMLESYNIYLELNEILDELPKTLTNQKKNKNYVNLFRQLLIQYVQQKQQYEMMNSESDENYFTFTCSQVQLLSLRPRSYIVDTSLTLTTHQGDKPIHLNYFASGSD